MKQAFRQHALTLGFDDCRFTTAAPPPSATRFWTWLKEKHHGDMAWLERNADKRTDPQLVLPNARSVITLAISYHTPAEPSSLAPRPSGEIARYARHADYHDVLAEKLKALTRFVNETGGPNTRSLWYVDTGPHLGA